MSYFCFDAQSSSVIYNALANPSNSLGRSLWSVREHCQSWGDYSSFSHNKNTPKSLQSQIFSSDDSWQHTQGFSNGFHLLIIKHFTLHGSNGTTDSIYQTYETIIHSAIAI